VAAELAIALGRKKCRISRVPSVIVAGTTGDETMRYLLLLHVEESGWERMSTAEQTSAMAAYGAFSEALSSRGALVAAGRLAGAASAGAVRTKGGKTVVMDGPYAETKEQVGGFYVIEAANRAEALDWAARCPAAGHGTVEVREVMG
jgi:hypothetical protein